MRKAKEKVKKPALPIQHWSYSSLMAFLRNPLAWYKRYVEKVYDTPSNPSAVVGRAGHVALQHFYQSRIASGADAHAHTLPSGADCKGGAFPGGISKEGAIDLGLEYLRSVPDFEINFGRAKSRLAQKKKREKMERDYLQAISFYLARPPKHKVLGVEVVAEAKVEGLTLPIKAVSDLVVQSREDRHAVDIVDHKFVDSFTKHRGMKTIYVIQAIFNYYTVKQKFDKPVRRFIVYECKKTRNIDSSPQMRRHIIDFRNQKSEFEVFHRLVNDATAEISRRRLYLPNPSDMFEGENSFDIYRLGLVD